MVAVCGPRSVGGLLAGCQGAEGRERRVHVSFTGAGRRGPAPPHPARGAPGRGGRHQAGAVRTREGARHPSALGDDQGRARASDRAKGGVEPHAMPTEPEPVTLSEVVHRAVQVVDPDGGEGLDDFLVRFEDADEPLSSDGADSVAQRIAEGIGALDPQEEDGAVQMAGAVATYLAYRRDEVDVEPGALLELAARAEFDGRPPEVVRAWLADVGIEL